MPRLRRRKPCAWRQTMPMAHVTLGRCYFAGGEEEKAASEYEAAVKLDPQDGEAYFALGQMRMFQRRTQPAEEALRHAIQVSPDLGPAYAELAQMLMGEGKNAEARALLEKAVALNSQDWQSQYELAVLLNQAGESARATDLLQKVLQVNPDYPGAREQMGIGLLRRGDLQGASALAGKMIAEHPQGPEGHRIMALSPLETARFRGLACRVRHGPQRRSQFRGDDGAAVHRTLGGGEQEGRAEGLPRRGQDGPQGGNLGCFLPLASLRRPRHWDCRRLPPQKSLVAGAATRTLTARLPVSAGRTVEA